MLYKIFLDAEFHVLDLLPKRGRPKIYENIHLVPLRRTNNEENYKDIKDIYHLTSHQFTRNISNHSRLKIPFLKDKKKIRNDKN